MASCNICGGQNFLPGPGGRLSSTGKLPLCAQCFSLERHRSYRAIVVKLQLAGLLSGKAIQFSEDKGVNPGWFAEFEISVYGGTNSLDIQKIDRESDTYDLVICNHVLEHVQYDNAALCELMRITKPAGLLFLAVPAPLQNLQTRDWGYPKKEDHGHYRIYGEDFTRTLVRYLPLCHMLYLDEPDPVTGMSERMFLISKTEDVLNEITSVIGQTTKIQ